MTKQLEQKQSEEKPRWCLEQVDGSVVNKHRAGLQS
jgi:hypothetical protein